jgi:rSAM/selenodomain-associated transferase 1
MANQVLLVFARAPQLGQAKTRLIPALGAEGAAALHAGLVEKTLQITCGGDFDVQLWCHPDTAQPFFHDCAARFSLSLHAQAGGDLGARMALALASTLQQHDSAVLIGTDCPSLSHSDLTEAFAALCKGADVALGPAADGGYYLVGLRRPCEDIFLDIDWGSAAVLSQTLARLRHAGLNHHLLAQRPDLDRPADLAGLEDRAAILHRGKQLVGLDR